MQNQHKNKLVTDTSDTLKMYTHTQEKKIIQNAEPPQNKLVTLTHVHTHTHTHTQRGRERECKRDERMRQNNIARAHTHTQLKKNQVNFCSFLFCYS